MNEPRWATPKQAAAHVLISVDLIRQAVNDAELKAYPVGTGKRDYRLDLNEVDEWMKSRSYEPRSA